jgi:hypothetical protein
MAVRQVASPATAAPSGVSSLNSPAAAIDAAGNSLGARTVGARTRLSDRRRTFRVKAKWLLATLELRFFIDIGVDAHGTVRELFIVPSTGKTGSLLALVAHDLAVALSRSLQSGATLEDLQAGYAAGGMVHFVCGQALELERQLAAEGALVPEGTY